MSVETKRAKGAKKAKSFCLFCVFLPFLFLLVHQLSHQRIYSGLYSVREEGLRPETRRYEDSRVSMACVYTVVAYGVDMTTLQRAASAALDEVDRIDRLMS